MAKIIACVSGTYVIVEVIEIYNKTAIVLFTASIVIVIMFVKKIPAFF